MARSGDQVMKQNAPGFDRRAFLGLAASAAAFNLLPARAQTANETLYDLPRFGNARILHMTDTHAQLKPVYFREPSVNIGVGEMLGRPPHIVGEAFLKRFGVSDARLSHAFTYLDFVEQARRFGRMGGFAHLKTLVDKLRAEAPGGRALLIDGGDLWQGSGLSNLMRGADMVEAANLLGIEYMTGHWEFTYGEEQMRANLAAFKGEFLAQNVFLTEEAAFSDAPAFDSVSGRAFKPATMLDIGGRKVALIGQAFPYVPIAHPKRFTPNWTFGVRDEELQKLVNDLREREKADAVILLSHNGMDVDLKLASRVTGIDLILGGHTHDAVPQPIPVTNASGRTLVTNAGSNGKYLAVVDMELGAGRVADLRYKSLPVFSDLLKPDPQMSDLIERLHAPHRDVLAAKVGVAGELLYRRGNFDGTTDRLICDALRAGAGAEISLSPGFRWGPSVLPGGELSMEDVLAQTATTYSEVYKQQMTGEQIKSVMEDVCDNLFNPDPYYQQGGDMVRVGGLSYRCAPGAPSGTRITELRTADGKPLEASRSYSVAGWASVNEQQGRPVWDVVADYVRSSGASAAGGRSHVDIAGVENNPGFGGPT